MKPGIRFHEAARDEYLEAARRYETARSGLGTEFQAELEAFLERASTRALPGSPTSLLRGRDIRRLPLHRFPYLLYFELYEDECIVWAVAHTRRRPGYWRRRS